MTKKPTSPILAWTLAVVCILCFPTVIVKWAVPDFFGPVTAPGTSPGRKFSLLLDTGIAFQRLGRYETAAYWFQKAEQSSPDQSESVVTAREHLAECYSALGRNEDAQRIYQALVKSSMETGENLFKKDQWALAVGRFEDAEKYAQMLTAAKFEAVEDARARQSACLSALNKYAEAITVTARLIEARRELGDPYDTVLALDYEQMAFERFGLQDWAGAEAAFLNSIEVYNAIVRHYSDTYDPSARGANARRMRDLDMMNLAAVYYNEKKMEQALSAAEVAYQGVFARPGMRTPVQLINVGVQSATALGNQEQAAVWEQRLTSLCTGPDCPP